MNGYARIISYLFQHDPNQDKRMTSTKEQVNTLEYVLRRTR